MDADSTSFASARTMNADALIAIFDSYTPALYKYVFRLCNNEVMADQIVGGVFTELLEQLSTGRASRANPRLSLYEIAYQHFMDEVHPPHRRAPEEPLRLTFTRPMDVEDRSSLEALMRAILNDLTDDQRHVIILRFMEGFSVKETAAIIGKKVGNVKVIQTRAIAALRKVLDNQVVDTYAICLMIRSLAFA